MKSWMMDPISRFLALGQGLVHTAQMATLLRRDSKPRTQQELIRIAGLGLVEKFSDSLIENAGFSLSHSFNMEWKMKKRKDDLVAKVES